MSKTLRDRGDALEKAFFSKMDEKLISDLRKKREITERRDKLREVSGITDESALEALISVGVSPDTLSAMAIVPLLHVAWGDNNLDNNERDAVLTAMSERGVATDSPTWSLLSSWLTREPKADLFDAWTAYIAELRSHLEPAAFDVMAKRVLEDCEVVARASGGIFGIGAVSADEKAAIGRISAVLAD